MKKKGKPVARSSFTRTFKLVVQDRSKPALFYQVGKVGRYSLLNGAMIAMDATSEYTPTSDSTTSDPISTDPRDICVLKTLDVQLQEVTYSGDDLLVPDWNVDIHFQDLPFGIATATNIPNMVFDAAGKYSVATPIFNGPGILCGQDCMPSTLIFNILVTGVGSDGVSYTAVGDKLFQHSPASPTPLSVAVKVIEPPPPPQPNQRPRKPREADLWFFFSAASMC